jgi:DNA-binding MarR family transcriptional regulator
MRAEYGTALGRIFELVVILNEDMTTSLAAEGLTVARARVMWHLHQRGPTTQKVIADALEVSPRTVTGLIDGLVATGFVTREPHPTDRRATLVSVTDKGARTVAAMARGRDALADLLFEGMPKKDFDGFVAALDEIVSRLRAAVR